MPNPPRSPVAGRYELLKKLGAGAFGEVYAATDRHDNHTVALKFLHAGGSDARDRFWREARILYAQMQNPYVVSILDQDLNANPPYLVLEYCAGGSLRSWVGRCSWRQAARVLVHVTYGLAGIHLTGGFHRDLKPENLLHYRAGEGHGWIKVSDFGIARVPETAKPPMTRGAGGTAGYIAPELGYGAPFTAAADVYSLGVVGAELLTARLDGSALSAAAAPQGLRALLLSMLDYEPARRPKLQRVQETLEQLLKLPSAPAPTVQKPQDDGTAAKVFVGLAMAALGALAFGGGEKKKWDSSVARYRGPDGRFRRR